MDLLQRHGFAQRLISSTRNGGRHGNKADPVQYRYDPRTSGGSQDGDAAGGEVNMRYPNDLAGIRFGRLTVIEKAGMSGEGKRGSRSLWLCRCDCGNEKIVSRNSLVTGNTNSCGCLEMEIKKTMHLKHGMAKTRLWNIWRGMRDRCSRERNNDYPHYGGKGIKVCEDWNRNFEAFKKWALKNGYEDDLTIDRIDNYGDYCPENCRWVTRKEQTRNRSITKTVTISEIAEIDGISYQEAYKKYVLRQ